MSTGLQGDYHVGHQLACTGYRGIDGAQQDNTKTGPETSSPLSPLPLPLSPEPLREGHTHVLLLALRLEICLRAKPLQL